MPAFNIDHHIHSIVQPNINDCWAACLAMATNMTVDRVKRIAQFNGVTLNPNGSLPENNQENVRLLGRGFQMRPVRISRIPAIQRLAGFMRPRPIVLLGRIRHRRGVIPHAIVVTRLMGGGRADNTFVTVYDPSERGSHPFSYDEFADRQRGPVPGPHFLLVR